MLEMNAHENDRYARYQLFDEESYQQPIYKGVRINMALKGQGGARGAGEARVAAESRAARVDEPARDAIR